MEIWDLGTPPREEAAAAVRELSGDERETGAGPERRALLARIPVVAWLVLATVVGTAFVAWLLART